MISHAISPSDALAIRRMGSLFTPPQFDRTRFKREASWISQNRGGNRHGDFQESSSEDIDADDEEEENPFEYYTMVFTPQKWVKDEDKDSLSDLSQRQKKFVILITNQYLFSELWLSPTNLELIDNSSSFATNLCVIAQRHISWNTHLQVQAAMTMLVWANVYEINLDDLIPIIAACAAAPRLTMQTFSPIENQRIGVGKPIDFWDDGLTAPFETPWPITTTWANKVNPYFHWCKYAEAGEKVQSLYKSMIIAEITTCSINNLMTAQRILRDQEIEKMNMMKKIEEKKQLKSAAIQRARKDDDYKQQFLEISQDLQDWEIKLPEGKSPESFYEKDLQMDVRRAIEIQYTSFDPYAEGDPLGTKRDFLQATQQPSFPKLKRVIQRELFKYKGREGWEKWRPGYDDDIKERKQVKQPETCFPVPYIRTICKFHTMEEFNPSHLIKLKNNKDMDKYPIDLVSRRYVPEVEELFDVYEPRLDTAFMAFRQKADGLTTEEFIDSTRDLIRTEIFSESIDFDYVIKDIWNDEMAGLLHPNIQDSQDLHLYIKFGSNWQKVMNYKRQKIQQKEKGIKDTIEKPAMSIDQEDLPQMKYGKY